jgi:hypothetical protein
MSKIPQGEWDAIAARYAKGESISRIAQSYGCTPPAIHYILKRVNQRGAIGTEQPLNGHYPSGPSVSVREGERRPAPITFPGSPRVASSERAPFVHPPELHARRHHELVSTRPESPLSSPPPQSESTHKMSKAAAAGAGLDRELHGRAEAAIEAFRLSFDAALAEASPDVRQRLRKAASDLMRVAARTTIVLDQLNARAERA